MNGYLAVKLTIKIENKTAICDILHHVIITIIELVVKFFNVIVYHLVNYNIIPLEEAGCSPASYRYPYQTIADTKVIVSHSVVISIAS